VSVADNQLESEVEGSACVYAKSRGWFCEKIMQAGRKGFPDRFFARNGVVMLIEFKRPGKPTPRMQQDKRHRELREAGVTVHVVSDLDHAKRLLK
jgi:hypothetical protein